MPVRQLTDFEWENPRQPPPKLEFDNAQTAFASHSSFALVRSLAVFSVGRAPRPCPAADRPPCHAAPILDPTYLLGVSGSKRTASLAFLPSGHVGGSERTLL